MKNIGIVGSRRRDCMDDFICVLNAFNEIYEPGDLIVSGGCEKGGDRFAEIIAKVIRCEPVLYLPQKSMLDPDLLKKNPRAAYAQISYARNALIAAKSDELIACVAPDRKGGTENTIKKWIKLHPGKRVLLV